MNEQPGVVSLSPQQATGVISASIRASVAAALKDVPENAKGAVVAIATEKGVNLAIAYRGERGLTVGAYVGKQWSRPIEGGIIVQQIWR